MRVLAVSRCFRVPYTHTERARTCWTFTTQPRSNARFTADNHLDTRHLQRSSPAPQTHCIRVSTPEHFTYPVGVERGYPSAHSPCASLASTSQARVWSAADRLLHPTPHHLPPSPITSHLPSALRRCCHGAFRLLGLRPHRQPGRVQAAGCRQLRRARRRSGRARLRSALPRWHRRRCPRASGRRA